MAVAIVNPSIASTKFSRWLRAIFSIFRCPLNFGKLLVSFKPLQISTWNHRQSIPLAKTHRIAGWLWFCPTQFNPLGFLGKTRVLNHPGHFRTDRSIDRFSCEVLDFFTIWRLAISKVDSVYQPYHCVHYYNDKFFVTHDIYSCAIHDTIYRSDRRTIISIIRSRL